MMLGVALILSVSIFRAVSVALMKRFPVALAPIADAAYKAVIGTLRIVAGAIAFEAD